VNNAGIIWILYNNNNNNTSNKKILIILLYILPPSPPSQLHSASMRSRQSAPSTPRTAPPQPQSPASWACTTHPMVSWPPRQPPGTGTTIGTPAFQTTHADSCASRACLLMEELLALPLGDLDRWLILHVSLQKRVAQLPRGSRWEYVGLAVHSTESKAVACDFAISAHPSTDGPLTNQLTLPLRNVGLGLTRTGHVEGYAAPPTSPPLLPPPSLPCKESPQSSCSVDPLLHIGATGPESIGATGATHLQLGLDRKWLTPLDLHI
jgi:hypothetical protein